MTQPSPSKLRFYFATSVFSVTAVLTLIGGCANDIVLIARPIGLRHIGVRASAPHFDPRLWVLKERNESFSLFFVWAQWREYSGLIGFIGDQPAYWTYWCYWKQNNKSPFVSVAIKARAEQVYLLCRAAATKRSAANLKGDLEGM